MTGDAVTNLVEVFQARGSTSNNCSATTITENEMERAFNDLVDVNTVLNSNDAFNLRIRWLIQSKKVEAITQWSIHNLAHLNLNDEHQHQLRQPISVLGHCRGQDYEDKLRQRALFRNLFYKVTASRSQWEGRSLAEPKRFAGKDPTEIIRPNNGDWLCAIIHRCREIDPLKVGRALKTPR